MSPYRERRHNPSDNGERRRSGEGTGVDAYGGPVFDPTKNVLDLVKASVERIDDMAELRGLLHDEQIASQRVIAKLRAKHEATVARLREEYQEKIQHAESGRIDSIRQVDREEVAKTAVAANTAITTLAKQTTDLQQTLAKQVADTAAAAETRSSAQYNDTNKRLSALELSSSEGKGKQGVFDPQMEKLTALVEVLARNQAGSTGKSEGVSLVGALAIGAVTLISGLLGIAGVLYALLKG